MFRKLTAAVALAVALTVTGLVTAAANAEHRAAGSSQSSPPRTSHAVPSTTGTSRVPAPSSTDAPPAQGVTGPAVHPAESPSTTTPASTWADTPSTSAPPAAPLATGPVTGTPAPSARPGAKVLYLTFDDGPDPVWTPQILQVLTQNHATATFFDIGESVAEHPDLVRAIRAQGSQVANHTWSHPQLTGLTDAEITAQLDRTDAVQGTARCVRPPYGATDARVDALIGARGQRVELWNVDTRDWTRPGVAAIEQQLLGARSGDIVLMHTGGGDRSQTVAAIRDALPILRGEGYALQGIPGC